MKVEHIKQTFKDKLKDCDKEVLIDIIADICSIYIGARVFADMNTFQVQLTIVMNTLKIGKI